MIFFIGQLNLNETRQYKVENVTFWTNSEHLSGFW